MGAIISGVFLLAIFNYPLVAQVGPWPAVVLSAVVGFPFALYGTAQTVCVQTYSDDGFRGRTVRLTFGIQGLSQFAGIAAAAPAAKLLGPLAINADTAAHLAAGALALAVLRKQDRATDKEPRASAL